MIDKIFFVHCIACDSKKNEFGLNWKSMFIIKVILKINKLDCNTSGKSVATSKIREFYDSQQVLEKSPKFAS